MSTPAAQQTETSQDADPSPETEPSSNPLAHYEQMYAEQPERYRRKVRRWMWLGYGYVLGIIALIVALVVGGGLLFWSGVLPILLLDNYIKIGGPALLLCGVMARGFFVRIPPPDGHRLTGALKSQVIDFFAETRKLSDGPKIDEVIIDTNVNAAVQQNRLFGVVGPTRNYLILGLPLLELATAEEMRAIIAHEFGHLNRSHGTMGASVYRLNATLYNSARAMEEKADSASDGIAFKFFRWFIPKFDELTFAMRRGQEYEADNTAVRATSKEAIASALCRLYALDPAVDRYWESLWTGAREQADNTAISPFSTLGNAIYNDFSAEEAKASVEQALCNITDYSDTHPCLKERLNAIDAKPVLAFETQETALATMVDSAGQEQLRELGNTLWREAAKENWQSHHSQHQESMEELKELTARLDTLNGEELIKCAYLEERYGRRETAADLFSKATQEDQNSALAHYHHGRVLLEQDFASGQKSLIKAAELDREFLPSVANMLHGALTEREMGAELAHLDAMIDTYNEKQAAYREERNSVSLEDELFAPTLPEEVQTKVQEWFDERPGVLELYAMQKPLEHYPDQPLYIVGTKIDLFSDDIKANPDRRLSELVDDMEALLGPNTTVMAIELDSESPQWIDRFGEVTGSLLCSKDKVKWSTRFVRSFVGAVKRILKWIAILIGIAALAFVALMVANGMGWVDLTVSETPDNPATP